MPSTPAKKLASRNSFEDFKTLTELMTVPRGIPVVEEPAPPVPPRDYFGCLRRACNYATSTLAGWRGSPEDPSRYTRPRAPSGQKVGASRSQAGATDVKLPYVCRINLLMVGESGVGKTSLVTRFTQGHFLRGHAPTIGVEFASKIVDTAAEGGKTKMKLHMWDTSGHESFRSLTRSYYVNALCIMIVFDVTRRQSFESLHNWVAKTRELAPQGAFIMLVGNKIDGGIDRTREVTHVEANDFAHELGLPYFETSARTGEGVEGLFNAGAEMVWGAVRRNELDPRTTKGIVIM